MPISLETSHLPRLAIVTAVDDCYPEHFRSLLDALFACPRFHPDSDLLWDLTDARVHLNIGDIRSVIQRARKIFSSEGAWRSVIVAETPLESRIVRTSRKLLLSEGFPARVLHARTLEEGIQLLAR